MSEKIIKTTKNYWKKLNDLRKMRQKIDIKSTWLYVLNARVACLCFYGRSTVLTCNRVVQDNYSIDVALSVSQYLLLLIHFVWLAELLCLVIDLWWNIGKFNIVLFSPMSYFPVQNSWVLQNCPLFFGIRSCPQTSSIITTLCTELNVNYLKNSE